MNRPGDDLTDLQAEAITARMVGLAEQIDAANAVGRAIVGPRRPPGPGLAAAIRRLVDRGDVQAPTLCGHINLQAPTVAWWTPSNPEVIACKPCHGASITAAPSSCYACRRPGLRTRRCLYLIAAEKPAKLGDHYLLASPPVVVEVTLCPGCRGEDAGRPERKKKRR